MKSKLPHGPQVVIYFHLHWNKAIPFLVAVYMQARQKAGDNVQTRSRLKT